MSKPGGRFHPRLFAACMFLYPPCFLFWFVAVASLLYSPWPWPGIGLVGIFLIGGAFLVAMCVGDCTFAD